MQDRSKRSPKIQCLTGVPARTLQSCWAAKHFSNHSYSNMYSGVYPDLSYRVGRPIKYDHLIGLFCQYWVSGSKEKVEALWLQYYPGANLRSNPRIESSELQEYRREAESISKSLSGKCSKRLRFRRCNPRIIHRLGPTPHLLVWTALLSRTP